MLPHPAQLRGPGRCNPPHQPPLHRATELSQPTPPPPSPAPGTLRRGRLRAQTPGTAHLRLLPAPGASERGRCYRGAFSGRRALAGPSHPRPGRKKKRRGKHGPGRAAPPLAPAISRAQRHWPRAPPQRLAAILCAGSAGRAATGAAILGRAE